MCLLMKKMILYTLTCLALLSGESCKMYDDSALWKQADALYKQIDALKPVVDAANAQVSMISAITQGGVVTGISQDADGNYVVSYKGADKLEHTLTLASIAQVNNLPVIGTQDVEGTLYWTITRDGLTTLLLDADGSKIPVTGRTPQIGLDNQGYWTVNGTRIKNAAGEEMASEGKSISVITGISVSSDKAVFTLGNGSTIEAPFDTFNVRFKYNGNYFLTECEIASATADAVITYEFVGEDVGDAVLRVMRTESLSVVQDASAKTLTVTPGAEFEDGSFTIVAGCDNDRSIIKIVSIVTAEAVPEYYGIKTAADMQNFAKRVNRGKKLDRFRNQETGEICLLSDVDMTGVTDWMCIGTEDMPFGEVFNGNGFAITNLALEMSVSESTSAGLFGYTDGATFKNLTLGNAGSRITLSGTNKAVTYAGALIGTAQNTRLISCTNNTTLRFSGNAKADTRMAFGGLCGVTLGTTALENCTNNGEVSTGKITGNTLSSSDGVMTGGLIGLMSAGTMTNCTNTGLVSCPVGRSGGLVGTCDECTVNTCVNDGTVDDDLAGQFSSTNYNVKRIGGLAGATSTSTLLKDCVNNGKVFAHHGCRAGGFVGHNMGKIQDCTNNGVILSDKTTTDGESHGPGWACGFNRTSGNLTGNRGAGRVGKYSSYSSNPDGAPYASTYNAVCHNYQSAYDPTANWETPQVFYDWKVEETKSLATGAKYTKYSTPYAPREINVVELDLAANPKIHLRSAISDDIVPNPNWNNNGNNGKKIRETLSEICTRKINAGQNIVAGVNGGFFDSNDGFPRGFMVSDGEMFYINGPWTRLPNHLWGFHVFTDRTTSCGEKSFKGVLEIAGKEHDYWSINDTTMRHGGTMNYAINLYTNRYKKTPHSGYSGTNPLATKGVFYIIAKYDGAAMISGGGFVSATVTKVLDGTSKSITPEYLSSGYVGVCVHKDYNDLASIKSVKVGDKIRLKGEVKISGASSDKVVYNSISSMFQFVKNGIDNSASAASHASYTTYDPVTFIATDEAATKVWIVEVDGRDTWTYLGATPYSMAQIALHLGAWNMTRFDGGGSASMWIRGKGTISHPSDSKGERSCMNYWLVRIDD